MYKIRDEVAKANLSHLIMFAYKILKYWNQPYEMYVKNISLTEKSPKMPFCGVQN